MSRPGKVLSTSLSPLHNCSSNNIRLSVGYCPTGELLWLRFCSSSASLATSDIFSRRSFSMSSLCLSGMANARISAKACQLSVISLLGKLVVESLGAWASNWERLSPKEREIGIDCLDLPSDSIFELQRLMRSLAAWNTLTSTYKSTKHMDCTDIQQLWVKTCLFGKKQGGLSL